MIAAIFLGVVGTMASLSLEGRSAVVGVQTAVVEGHDTVAQDPAGPFTPTGVPLGTAPRKDLFSKLFRPRGEAPITARERAYLPGTTGAKPKVVCGLTIWEVDPGLDAGIRRVVPDRGLEFAIRRLRPSVCVN
jgi:hypothetical protein